MTGIRIGIHSDYNITLGVAPCNQGLKPIFLENIAFHRFLLFCLYIYILERERERENQFYTEPNLNKVTPQKSSCYKLLVNISSCENISYQGAHLVLFFFETIPNADVLVKLTLESFVSSLPGQLLDIILKVKILF